MENSNTIICEIIYRDIATKRLTSFLGKFLLTEVDEENFKNNINGFIRSSEPSFIISKDDIRLIIKYERGKIFRKPKNKRVLIPSREERFGAIAY